VVDLGPVGDLVAGLVEADPVSYEDGPAVGAVEEPALGADVERIVFDGRSRVLDVGAHRRFYEGADRRAIIVRDRACFHPTCDEVPARPEIDHHLEASRGGPTTLDNGRLGCRFHNNQRNRHPDNDPDPPARSHQ
jgi:hypothetical protein